MNEHDTSETRTGYGESEAPGCDSCQVQRSLSAQLEVLGAFLTAPPERAIASVVSAISRVTQAPHCLLHYMDTAGKFQPFSSSAAEVNAKEFETFWKPVLEHAAEFDSADPIFVPELRRVTSSVFGIPIRDAEAGVIGVMAVAGRAFDDSDRDLVRSLASTIAPILQRLRQTRGTHGRQRIGGLVGTTRQMQMLFRQIEEIAGHESSILLLGESGVGKELIARTIHDLSGRTGTFVPVNCGTLPETLFASELFGHVEGAFVGAIREKRGRLEVAHQGTIFIDELADLPLSVQSRMWEFLEKSTFSRVGDNRPIGVDVRIVSASRIDPAFLVNTEPGLGSLFDRLGAHSLQVPPLRERTEDIALLTEHFLAAAGSPQARLTNDSLRLLQRYSWPGNVRELENALEFARVRSRGGPIEETHLPDWVVSNKPKPPQPKRGRRKKLNPEVVFRALEETGGNKNQAAKRLGICRATLYNYLKEYF